MLNGYISDIQCIVTFSKLDFIGADALTIIYAVIGGTDEKKKIFFVVFFPLVICAAYCIYCL